MAEALAEIARVSRDDPRRAGEMLAEIGRGVRQLARPVAVPCLAGARDRRREPEMPALSAPAPAAESRGAPEPAENPGAPAPQADSRPDGGAVDLRPLALTERVAVPEDAAPAAWGAIEMVPVAALAVDPAYQRPVGPAGWRLVRRIAADLDPAAFGVLLGYWSGGLFALVDGQHRALAAMARGEAAVPCRAAPSASAAAAFVRVNRARVALTPAQLYHAERAAGAADAAGLAAICADLGITVPRSAAGGRLGPGELGCVRLARGEVARDGGARLRRALHLLMMAPPPDGRPQLSQIGVRAALAVLAALDAEVPGGRADHALGRALAGLDLARAAAEARATASRAGHPAWVSLGQAMARAMADAGGPEIAVAP